MGGAGRTAVAESRDLLAAAQRGSTGTLLRQVHARFTAAGPWSRDVVVLDALAGQDAASQQDLAARLSVNRTIMVGLLDRLEVAGYVTRTRNPANRRTYVLSLTGAGAARWPGCARTRPAARSGSPPRSPRLRGSGWTSWSARCCRSQSGPPWPAPSTW